MYLAVVLTTHDKMCPPAFCIYGNDICDAFDTEIPRTVCRQSGGYNAQKVIFADTIDYTFT